VAQADTVTQALNEKDGIHISSADTVYNDSSSSGHGEKSSL
jgi:hypothetical protein